MPYYGVNGKILNRVDEANNVFNGVKCENPIAKPDTLSVYGNGEFVKSTLTKVSDTRLQVTGHIASFTYGHTKDEDGNPICKIVNTGHDAW